MASKNTLRQFKFFSIFEYEKEQDYLREMHKQGWAFNDVRGLGSYHFVKCTPEDVVYALDYNKEGLAHKAEYVQMFADCGWEYLQDFFGFSYFRKPAADMQGNESIFCDDESRLAMIERIYRGRLLPLLVIFCALILPQFVLNCLVYHNVAISVLYGALLGAYVTIFVMFARRYARYKGGRK